MQGGGGVGVGGWGGGGAASTETIGGAGFRLPATLVQHCQLRLCGRL